MLVTRYNLPGAVRPPNSFRATGQLKSILNLLRPCSCKSNIGARFILFTSNNLRSGMTLAKFVLGQDGVVARCGEPLYLLIQ